MQPLVKHTAIINDKGPVTCDVECDCGEFSFKDAWDDMVHAWNQHAQDPDYGWITNSSTLLLTRAGMDKIKHLLRKDDQ